MNLINLKCNFFCCFGKISSIGKMSQMNTETMKVHVYPSGSLPMTRLKGLLLHLSVGIQSTEISLQLHMAHVSINLISFQISKSVSVSSVLTTKSLPPLPLLCDLLIECDCANPGLSNIASILQSVVVVAQVEDVKCDHFCILFLQMTS